MFPGRYFPSRYFCDRYWVKAAAAADTGAPSLCGTPSVRDSLGGVGYVDTRNDGTPSVRDSLGACASVGGCS